MSNRPQWIEAFLRERRYAVLATHNDDGSTHLTPVWYLFEDGRFFVETFPESRKVRNVVTRPSASLVVDARTPGSERWVSASGPVQVLRGELSRSVNDKILRRYLTEEALRHPVIGPGMASTDAVTLSLQPVQWRWWDAEMFDAQFGGLLSQTPQKWFLPLD
jgi:PPOX class probable F420-dependent enzyme